MNNQNELQNQEKTRTISYEVNGQTVNLAPQTVRDYLVSGNGKVTNQEVVMFLNLCKFQRLNPFLNEAYLIKFGNQAAQIVVSKEAFMKRAESNESFKGFEAGVIVQRNDEIVEIEGAIKLPNDILIGAYANVFRSDRDKPVKVKISIDEFGKSQATWKQMPLNMIRKTAIVNALREAFPNSLGAMYTEDDAQPEQFNNTQQTQESLNQEVKEQQASKEIDFEPKEKVEVAEKEKQEPEVVENEQPKEEKAKQQSLDELIPNDETGSDVPF